MALLKKNIWSLFWLILLVSTLLASYYVSHIWQRTFAKYNQMQSIQVDIFSNDIHNFLRSQSSLLEALGNQLSINTQLPTQPMHSKVLDRVRATHPTVAGLGLANLQGDLLVVSSNLNLEKLPNLLQTEITRDSFLDAIESSKLVPGRPYILKSLKNASMAFAIRRAIRNDDNEVISVMTGGIKVDQSTFKIGIPEFQRIDIIRDDGFYQFSSEFTTNSEIYNTPFSTDALQIMQQRIMQKYNIDSQTLHASTDIYSIEMPIDGTVYELKVKRDPYFEFWVVSRITKERILSAFYREGFILLFLYITSCSIFLFLVRSIASNEKEKYAELHHQALHDPLTGLPNLPHLKQEIEAQGSNHIALIFINIDRLKSINDAYGHSYGDRVLIDVSRRLAEFAPKGRTLTRGVSDEFFLLMPEQSQQQLKTLCDDILHTLAEPYMIQKTNILLTASIAVTSSSVCGSNIDTLIRSLDIAMLEAKKNKNTICFVSDELQKAHLEYLDIERRLRNAIKDKKFTIAYQPQVDTSGQLYGVEALVRWIDDEIGFVAPDKFIAIAEQSGLMPQLGTLIIDIALQEKAKLCRELNTDFTLSLNISVMQLLQTQFIDTLLRQIEENQIDPRSLILELTESVFIEDIELIAHSCNALIEHGMRLSLDDFGTGYSSLNLLNKLPFSELKVDKSFVDEINSDQQSLIMVKSIIDIAKNYEMSVIAEGVEAQSQHLILAGCGCDHYQGYLFAKPMPTKELKAYIEMQKKASPSH